MMIFSILNWIRNDIFHTELNWIMNWMMIFSILNWMMVLDLNRVKRMISLVRVNLYE